MNLGNIEYQQSVAERHHNLVLKCAYLKDLDDVDSFTVSGADGGKENEQGKVGIYVIAVINYKNTFMVNIKPVTVCLNLG